jgi:hypothetical protein
MPTTFAYLALFGYPVVAAFMFRRLPLARAISWTLLLGLLFLPQDVSVNLPLLPTLDKTSIPSLTAMLLTWLRIRSQERSRHISARLGNPGLSSSQKEPQTRPAGAMHRVILLLFISLVTAPLFTVLTNRDPVFFGNFAIRGLEWYDAFSMILASIVSIIPFFLARRHFASKEGFIAFAEALAICGAIYSILVIFEIRVSPQLHKWVYGFYPHSFLQQVRGGGFRAMVFMDHGLKVALFISAACIAALSLASLHPEAKGRRWLWLALWLLSVLLFQKSLGAVLITIPLAILTVFFRPKARLAVCLGLVSSVLLYPMLRGADLIPVTTITEFASSISSDRAASFNFRLENEDRLLERAMVKPWFGWGGWGRPRLYSERGRDLSVTDGAWIIYIGVSGWIGYISLFGCWCIPIILLWHHRRSIGDSIPPHVTASCATLLTVMLLDLIPNTGLQVLNWVLAGALLGIVESQRKSGKKILKNPQPRSV